MNWGCQSGDAGQQLETPGQVSSVWFDVLVPQKGSNEADCEYRCT